MLFSIIIPIYNIEKYINRCVDSVLEQDYDDYEVLLIDDGSIDGSRMICDKYARYDSRVRVVHKENGGAADARNCGLKIAKGEYVIFLDGDDYYDDKGALSKIKKRIEETYSPDVIIIGFTKWYQLSGKKIKSRDMSHIARDEGIVSIEKLMKRGYFIGCAWDKIVRREFILNNKLSFVKGQLVEDKEWCVQILKGKPRITIMDEYFYTYRRQVSSSITNNISRKHILDLSSEIVKAYEENETNDVYLNHFLANEYVLWMVATSISNENIKDIVKEMGSYWFLIQYDWYPYVKKIRKIGFLGYDNIRLLLGTYYKFLKRNR